MRLAIALPISLLLILAGCSQDEDFFAWARRDSKTRPVPKPAATSPPAPAEPAPSDGTQSAEPSPAKEDAVNQRVTQYASGFPNDDFMAKIDRQSAPSRERPAHTVRLEPPTRSAGVDDHADNELDESESIAAESPPDAESTSDGRADEAPAVPDPHPAAAQNPPAYEPEPDTVPIPPPAAAAPRFDDPRDLEAAHAHESAADPSLHLAPDADESAADLADDPTNSDESDEADDLDAPPTASPAARSIPIQRPPVLQSISIDSNAAAQTADSEPDASPLPTANLPAASAAAEPPLSATIAGLEETVAQNPNDLEQQFRLRLLYLATGQDEKALADTPGMNDDVQPIVRGLIRSLIEARSGAGRDPAAWANRQLAAVEELRALLRARADLAVPVVALCTRIEAFGLYEPIVPADFPAGRDSEAVIYVEIENYRTEQTPRGEFRTLLSMRTSLLTKAGAEVWSAHDDNIEDVARRPRDDFFLVKKVVLPATLTPGDYVLKVEIEDKLAGKLNGNSVDIRILANMAAGSTAWP